MDPFISTYSHSIGSVMSAAFLNVFTQQQNLIYPILEDWIWVIVLVFFGLTHQLALSKACELETNPSNIAIICSSEVVMFFFMDIVFMGAEVNLYALLGSVIVMISIMVLLRSKSPPPLDN